MNERIDELMYHAGLTAQGSWDEMDKYDQEAIMRLVHLVIEDVLDQVQERAHCTGDRDWNDEIDRPWIQLVFGYGALHTSKNHGIKDES